MNAWVLLWDWSRRNPNVLGGVGTCLGWFWFIAFWNYRGNHSTCVYAFTCIVHACAGGLHVYTFMFINSLWTHASACIHMQVPAYACWYSKTSFFVQFDFFSHLFSLSNHDSYAPFQPLLQVLLPFTSRGCTSRISSWYMALTKDTKALVHTAGFELVILLFPEGFASGILV